MKKVSDILSQCVACGNCVIECPIHAVSIEKGLYAKVDKNKCAGCGKCIKGCPAGAIVLVNWEGENHEE